MLDQAIALLDRTSAFYGRAQPFIVLLLLLIIVVALAANAILNRGMPRIGGKIGRRAVDMPAVPVPAGFSRVDCREITNFVATSEAEPYANVKAYARAAVALRPGMVRVYRVAACNTRIEIPAETPDYNRIDAAEALALLRELPDPRLVYRLQLNDQPSLLDPWVRKVTGHDIYSLGNATLTAVIVIYRPDRRLDREIGITLLHEWLHLLAFKSAKAIRRFKRADKIERLPALQFEPVSFGDSRTPIYEAWCILGETLLGYDETAARQAALASPVHAVILWRRIEKILRKVPKRLASTRLANFQARSAFMRMEVAPKARAVRANRRWWKGLLRQGAAPRVGP